MSDPFVGEVTAFSFNWAPQGYALCNGAMLPVQQNQALYSLLGNQFGGTPGQTVGIPDLRGRSPLGIGQQSGGSAYNQGNSGGLESAQLTMATVPAHQHTLNAATNNGGAVPPTGNLIATVVASGSSTQNFSAYKSGGWTADTALNAGSVGSAGGNQGHNNMQPYSVVNFCIALTGIYPSRP